MPLPLAILTPLLTVPAAAAAAAAAASGDRWWAYAIFLALVGVFLLLDLGVFHREAREVSFREAAAWSAVWLSLGVAFSGVVYAAYEQKWFGLGIATAMYSAPDAVKAGASLITLGDVGGLDAARQYLVGYVVEKSLAMDNIFVIALIFSSLAVPARYQHRVLFWGIIGALAMRGAMIFVGAGLIVQYQWILIVFGGFLILTAAKMALITANDDPSKSLAVRVMRRLFRSVDFYDGQRFFTRRTLKPTYSIDPLTGISTIDPAPPGTLSARLAMTPLFVALLLVEISDLIFAVDSIPAIFAITPDPFIVFASNIFAVLGLRALYFCLEAMIRKFRYLKPALIVILAFVGVKLLLLSVPPYLGWIGLAAAAPIKVNTTLSLAIVLGTLALAIVGSVAAERVRASRVT